MSSDFKKASYILKAEVKYKNKNQKQKLYMCHQDQYGEKVGQMSLFDWKLEAATDRGK